MTLANNFNGLRILCVKWKKMVRSVFSSDITHLVTILACTNGLLDLELSWIDSNIL